MDLNRLIKTIFNKQVKNASDISELQTDIETLQSNYEALTPEGTNALTQNALQLAGVDDDDVLFSYSNSNSKISNLSSIEVRRASDSEVFLIGYNNGELDTSKLKYYGGEDDQLYVTKLFDLNGFQCGEQTTASYQPLIYDSGTVYDSPYFDGDDDYIDVNFPDSQFPMSILVSFSHATGEPSNDYVFMKNATLATACDYGLYFPSHLYANLGVRESVIKHSVSVGSLNLENKCFALFAINEKKNINFTISDGETEKATTFDMGDLEPSDYENMSIGARHTSSKSTAYYFNGDISNIYILSRELTVDEAKTILGME